MSLYPIKSKVDTRTSFTGENHKFFDFIDRVGPNGGRVIIDGFWLHAQVQGDITVATIDGRDLARIFGFVMITQTDGVKRYALPGDLLRIASYAFEGSDRYIEMADQTVGNDRTFIVSIYCPLSKRFLHTPEDFGLPADMFKEIQITQPTAGFMSVTGTFSLDSVSYWVDAEWHEDFDCQIYNVDEVTSTDFTSTGEATLSLGGKLQDLYFHAAGAGGGASLANLTDIRIDALSLPVLLRNPDLITVYRRARNEAANLLTTNGNDLRSSPFVPVGTAKAAAAMIHSRETSAWDGRVVRQAKLNLTNTVASLRAIHRMVVPASDTLRNQTNAAYGLTPKDYRVATDKKTMRDPNKWPKSLRPFLRLKGPLKLAA